MKILLASGHKPGYNVCKSTGVNEGDLNVELVKKLKAILDKYADVTVYPYERDMYKDNKNCCLKVNFKDYDYVFEIHFNAAGGGARGVSVQLHSKYKGGISVEQAIANNIAAIGFKKRGTNGIVRRSDLMNMNSCYNRGVDYALLETCFYDSASDMALYKKNKDKVAQAIANGIVDKFGLKSNNAGNTATKAKVVNCTELNVRAVPNGKPIIGEVKGGSTVYIIGTGKDSDGDVWYKVQAGSYIGYVWTAYIAK